MEREKNNVIYKSKELEKEILYSTTHDTLTGLYSRSLFLQQLRKYDSCGRYPLSVVIADINGLKMVNEVFGFTEGDKLLKKIAGILSLTAGASNSARWGGDEFAVLLPESDEVAVESLCRQILNECEKIEASPVKPSIALGSAAKKTPSQNLDRIILEAEDRMYRHKLLETRSTHSSIISSLRKALFERSFETEEHAQRMRIMSYKIGKALGLSRDELDELCLLSVLHDIGKIAIPDKILSKPDKLTDEEWKEMKKHSEIGYRIAAASNELSSIAEYILSHHERWDGNGYPQGLKGMEIPKLAQIIAVVDTYDAITNDRPYRAAMSQRKALLEIKRCSGTQFSPHIAEAFLDIFVE